MSPSIWRDQRLLFPLALFERIFQSNNSIWFINWKIVLNCTCNECAMQFQILKNYQNSTVSILLKNAHYCRNKKLNYLWKDWIVAYIFIDKTGGNRSPTVVLNHSSTNAKKIREIATGQLRPSSTNVLYYSSTNAQKFRENATGKL